MRFLPTSQIVLTKLFWLVTRPSNIFRNRDDVFFGSVWSYIYIYVNILPDRNGWAGKEVPWSPCGGVQKRKTQELQVSTSTNRIIRTCLLKARPDSARSQDMRPRPRPLKQADLFRSQGSANGLFLSLKNFMLWLGCTCHENENHSTRQALAWYQSPRHQLKMSQDFKPKGQQGKAGLKSQVEPIFSLKAPQTGAARLDQATMSESCVNQAKVAGSGNRASSKVVHRQCAARGLWGSKAAIRK